MSESSKIAELLQAASPSSPKTGKSLFWAILIISWCVIIGVSIGAIYCGVKWKQVAADYKSSDARIQELQNTVSSQNVTITSLRKQLQDLQAELDTTRTERDTFKAQVKKLEEQLLNATRALNDTQDALKKEKEEHEKCKTRNKELEGQYNKIKSENDILKKNVTDLNHTMHQQNSELLIYKIASAGILAVTVVGAVDDILNHIKLWEKEAYLKIHDSKIVAFPYLVKGFVGLELASKHWGKFLKARVPCNNYLDFSKCVVDAPTVTTITTTTGEEFGLVLYAKFPTQGGTTNDEKAFAFSGNNPLVGMATAKSGNVAAMTLGKGGYDLTFGTDDVVVYENGKKVKFMTAGSFHYPERIGYPKFYVNLTTPYDVANITTEIIQIDPK